MKKAVQQWLCIRCLHPSFSRPPDDMLCRSCRKVAIASADVDEAKHRSHRRRGHSKRPAHSSESGAVTSEHSGSGHRRAPVDGHTQAQEAEPTQVRTLRGERPDQRPVGRQPQRKNARRSS